MTALASTHHIGVMFAEAIRQALEAWPGSLRSLAREAGVAHSTLVRIRDGEFEASPEVTQQIATALEVAGSRCQRAAQRLRRSLKRRSS